jgi:hypothetical protein
MIGGLVTLVGCQPMAAPPTSETSPAAVQSSDAVASEAAAHVSEGNPQGVPPSDAPVVATAGVGKEGQSLKGESGLGGMIAAPASTLFSVRQRAVFEIKIPQAINLFQGLEGRKPKDHEEFMTKIIQANSIALPELPSGKIYRYHPDDGQLYVHNAE